MSRVVDLMVAGANAAVLDEDLRTFLAMAATLGDRWIFQESRRRSVQALARHGFVELVGADVAVITPAGASLAQVLAEDSPYP